MPDCRRIFCPASTPDRSKDKLPASAMRSRSLLVLALLPELGCAGEGVPARPEPVKDPATLGADLLTLGPPLDPILRGVLVERVEEGGPAALGGLRPDDIIRQVDEER